MRWKERNKKELKRKRTEQSFVVSKKEIADSEYDLSLNRYKEIIFKQKDNLSPQKILGELIDLETQLQADLKELTKLIK